MAGCSKPCQSQCCKCPQKSHMKENKINHHVIKDIISIHSIQTIQIGLDNGNGDFGHRDKDKCNNNGKIGGVVKDNHNGHNNVIHFMVDAKDFHLSGCGGLMIL